MSDADQRDFIHWKSARDKSLGLDSGSGPLRLVLSSLSGSRRQTDVCRNHVRKKGCDGLLEYEGRQSVAIEGSNCGCGR
jgi:hypothetical protein